jgi:pimeloyl-ACP methyl ester carboxylesterase
MVGVELATNPKDGVRIAYRTFGSGPAVVLVHGTALSQAIWRGFGYVQALSTDHTVITLDLRGHGRSDKPHDPPSYRIDVLAVLDRLQIEQAHYLGYSLGARVGFALGDTHPERISSLISVAGAPGNQPGAFDRVFFDGCILALEDGGMAGFLDAWQDSSGPLDKPTVGAFAANDAEALAAYMRESENDTGVPTDRLAGFVPPVLLLVGSEDGERLTAARQVQAVLPTAKLQVIDGATHGDVLRRPETAEAVRLFLARFRRPYGNGGRSAAG